MRNLNVSQVSLLCRECVYPRSHEFWSRGYN